MSLRPRNLIDARIGEVVEENGILYRCVKDIVGIDNCQHCDFRRSSVTTGLYLCPDYECLGYRRKDKTNVHFIKVKREEVEPWELSEK